MTEIAHVIGSVRQGQRLTPEYTDRGDTVPIYAKAQLKVVSERDWRTEDVPDTNKMHLHVGSRKCFFKAGGGINTIGCRIPIRNTNHIVNAQYVNQSTLTV